jgi:hypothetical protein
MTPPEEQDFMNPPPGMADQASKGADMTLESAIRHQQEDAEAELMVADEQQNISDDDTIDPDIPVAVGEPVEEYSKMTQEELDQYNTAVRNGIEAGVEVLFDAQVAHQEISNLTFSGVETNFCRNLAAEQAAVYYKLEKFGEKGKAGKR